MKPHLSTAFQPIVADRVDLRKQIRGWHLPDFDDSQWKDATPLMRHVGWPSPQKNASPQALTPPWTSLHLRDVPYLLEEEVRAENLILAEEVDSEFQSIPLSAKIDKQLGKGFSAHKEGKSAIEIFPSRNARILLFDLGEVKKWDAKTGD